MSCSCLGQVDAVTLCSTTAEAPCAFSQTCSKAAQEGSEIVEGKRK